ncbi:MAG: peptidylprolyl isomerase [Phycisphaerae bacterium]
MKQTLFSNLIGVEWASRVKSRRSAMAVFAVLVTFGITGCANMADPVEEQPLTVTASADSDAVFEGGSVVLTATASVDEGNLFYRWNVNEAPVELDLGIVTESTLTVGPLDELGRYVFRVQLADDTGRVDFGFVTVEVVSPFETSVPRLIMVGEATELTLSGVNPDTDLVANWSVEGDAVIADPDATTTTLTANSGGTFELTLNVTLGGGTDAPSVSTETFRVVSFAEDLPQVRIETNEGSFTVELENEAAPLHTANFLQYVDEGFYEGLLFHRIACIVEVGAEECLPFVLQGGGFERIDGELVLREPTQDTVPSEADNGLRNFEAFTISLALSGAVDTGQAQFFVNLGQNGALDLQGFTVFGRVVDGFDTLDLLNTVETEESVILVGEESQPVEDVVIERMMRIEP